jgi:hypothetical protein
MSRIVLMETRAVPDAWVSAAIRLDGSLARAWLLRGQAFYALTEFQMAARYMRAVVFTFSSF